MKIRALTIGITLNRSDFINENNLKLKLNEIILKLNQLINKLLLEGYETQTKRITLNSFENWIEYNQQHQQGEGEGENINLEITLQRIKLISNICEENQITFCSLGCATKLNTIQIIPKLLSISSVLYAHTLINSFNISKQSELLLESAKVSIELSKFSSDGLKNFSYCTSFNCPSNVPFYPASYHQHQSEPIVTVALECGELLFLAFHGVTNEEQATNNLSLAYRQTLLPIQSILKHECELLNIIYGGIDGSMNPGLSIVESVGKGIEELAPHQFGSWGTLSTVSIITKSIKSLINKTSNDNNQNNNNNNNNNDDDSIKLCGYSGLMLPVMEDLHLAAIASEVPSRYNLKDLLMYSSVCGVGLDTIPIPGNVTPQQLYDIYIDISTLSTRLNKPLSCRLLIMPGLNAGDMTNVSSPYLCNTRVFSVT